MKEDEVVVHEAAHIFPLDEETIPALADDIRRNGQLVPIQRLGGEVIDGRRRLRACQMAGVEPRFEDIDFPVPDPIAHAWSLNGAHRHLTKAQLAMVGARMRALYDRQAKERMGEGQRSGGRGHKKNSPANLPESSGGDARDAVGKTIGVSGKSIDHATRVLRNAVPEVVRAVEEGRMAVSTAAILSTEPEDVQRKEATDPRRNRNYKSVSKPQEEPAEEGETPEQPKGRMPVGVVRAKEAVNCLIRIPKNDPLRKRGFQIVKDWMRHNP